MKKEREVGALNGIVMLFVTLALYVVAGYALYAAIREGNVGRPVTWLIVGSVAAFLAATFASIGFFIVEPNGSKALLLFGNYKGTVKAPGLHWANPFMS